MEKQPNYVMKIITYLNPVMSSPYESQKVMAAAFFAEVGDVFQIVYCMFSLNKL